LAQWYPTLSNGEPGPGDKPSETPARSYAQAVHKMLNTWPGCLSKTVEADLDTAPLKDDATSRWKCLSANRFQRSIN